MVVMVGGRWERLGEFGLSHFPQSLLYLRP